MQIERFVSVPFQRFNYNLSNIINVIYHLLSAISYHLLSMIYYHHLSFTLHPVTSVIYILSLRFHIPYSIIWLYIVYLLSSLLYPPSFYSLSSILYPFYPLPSILHLISSILTLFPLSSIGYPQSAILYPLFHYPLSFIF